MLNPSFLNVTLMLTDPYHECMRIALVVFITDPIFVVVYNIYGLIKTNRMATLSNLERNTIITICETLTV